MVGTVLEGENRWGLLASMQRQREAAGIGDCRGEGWRYSYLPFSDILQWGYIYIFTMLYIQGQIYIY